MLKPKPKRIDNLEARRYAVQRRDGCCMVGLARPGRYGQCTSGLDAHHIDNKGAGGDDVKENLISLCRGHHQMAQEHKISKGELRQILADYYGYHYG